jgi:thiamine biosynthesis lipoprotein
MGCQMSIWLQMEDAQAGGRLLREAEAMFRSAEGVLSRFDSASELTWLNGRPGRWTAVSDLMWSVITRALFMAEETGGLFDPTQLAALESAGYDRSFAQMSRELVVDGAETAVGCYGQWQAVQLDAGTQSVWLPPGVRLDLGGIAKGHTAQQVVDFLRAEGPCLVDAGGDLTAGAAPLDWPGWPVAVAAPYHKEDADQAGLLQLWLVDGTMATSGIDYRRWQRNGRPAHHVIDPRTGMPAVTDLLTTTVLARAAVRAEAWATAALVAGSAAAGQQLSAIGLAAVLLGWQNDLILTPALTPFLAAGALEN